MKAAVIILNWNGEKLLEEFLPSVICHTNPRLGKVIVVDNCSTDASVEVMLQKFPEVELIRFEENYGFAGGYNRAIARIDAEYVVLLNSDVEVTSGWLEPLVGKLEEDPELVAVQPKIKAWKDKTKFEYAGACGGYIDRYGFPFCRGRILDCTETDRGQYDEAKEVFWCSGAALCIRRNIYLQCGGLDERFFAHMEEIDLCWRMRNRGFRLQVEPASVVYHLGGGSLPMNHPRKLFLNYRNNLLMLYKNLPEAERKRILRVRKWLDRCSQMVFWLKGQKENARSVKEAYRSFAEMKSLYSDLSPVVKKECIYPGSIIYAYFIRHIRTFSALRW